MLIPLAFTLKTNASMHTHTLDYQWSFQGFLTSMHTFGTNTALIAPVVHKHCPASARGFQLLNIICCFRFKGVHFIVWDVSLNILLCYRHRLGVKGVFLSLSSARKGYGFLCVVCYYSVTRVCWSGKIALCRDPLCLNGNFITDSMHIHVYYKCTVRKYTVFTVCF